MALQQLADANLPIKFVRQTGMIGLYVGFFKIWAKPLPSYALIEA